jgi:NADPH:quinone reductase-like Zn-dependent oxidoreductase
MKAAIITEIGKPPVYGDFKEPIPAKDAAKDEVLIHVKAAALSRLTRSKASGKHYSSTENLPLVPGTDGVGLLADSGKRVLFILPPAPFGSMAEKVAVKASHCVPVPDGLDDVSAAALANPGMSSWSAFKERARLGAGETVLVNGATGAAGRLAVQIAKHLGAKKIIATGRDPEILNKLTTLGADVTISLTQPKEALQAAFEQEFKEGVNVVVDYLWGPTAELLIAAAASQYGSGREATPIRYVEVGEMSGPNVTLPGGALRSTAIELMGSGIGSVPLDRLLNSIRGVLEAALPAHLEIETAVYPLSEVETAWSNDKNKLRTVFNRTVKPHCNKANLT